MIGFLPVSYLALSGGGYDIVVRSEVGILFWWGLLLAVAVGVLPRTRWSWPGWVATGLLAGFLAWTWIAAGWSQSDERTLVEVARVATYLGVFTLGLCVVTRANVASLLNGLGCAIVLVAGLAVLSRLEPSWFPPSPARAVYAPVRLSYPFDYPDGVGEFAALGIPLLLCTSTSARTFAGRAFTAAGLPVVAVCVALTVSRGGVLACAVGLVFFFALVPDRLPRAATALIAAGATAIPLLALLQYSTRRAVLLQGASTAERHSVLAVMLLACAGAAVLQLTVTLAVRHGMRPRWLRFSRRSALAFAAVLAGAVAAAVVAGLASGVAHHLWQEFKRPNPAVSGKVVLRLLSIAGSHRYQYWQAAIAAFHSAPLKGIGPGTFQFFWAQHNSLGEFVRNAHSLYFETLAEAGIVGLALIGGLVVFVLVTGSIRALRATAATRLAIATGVAGFAAFASAAGFDWVWQIGAIPMVALLLAAVAVSAQRDRDRIDRGQPLALTRVAVAVTAAVSLYAIVVPLAATVEVRDSQAAAAVEDWPAAMRDAVTAQKTEPSAATPRLQRALVLEAVGEFAPANAAIDAAIARQPTDASLWATASRIALEAGRVHLALADWHRARGLDPTWSIFHQ